LLLSFPIIGFLCLNMRFKAFHCCIHGFIFIYLIMQFINGVGMYIILFSTPKKFINHSLLNML
jgi:hypothetical protein